MSKFKINHYAIYTDLKASIVERLNRTLKGRIREMITAKGTSGLVYYPNSVQSTAAVIIGLKV